MVAERDHLKKFFSHHKFFKKIIFIGRNRPNKLKLVPNWLMKSNFVAETAHAKKFYTWPKETMTGGRNGPFDNVCSSEKKSHGK